MTSAGAAVEWFAREWIRGRATAATIESLAAQVPAGAGGMLFLPYLQGERTPVWDPYARGVMLGFQLNTGRQHAARAVLEGTAFGMRMIAETLESSYRTRASRIVAVGGGTQNRLWMRIKASALGRPIHVMRYQQTSTLGAAMLAGHAAGMYKDARHAIDSTRGVRRTSVVRPEKSWTAIYNRLYPIYRELYHKHAQDFRVLNDVAESAEARD
jgi:xylulokinase